MNAKNFSIAMGEVGEKYVIEAANYYKKRGTGGWMKWLGVVACLCFVIVGIFTYKGNGPVSNVKSDSCALPGADKIYPAILVNGNLYEWHMGSAVFYELPKGVVYYGKIKHIDGEKPEYDRDMVSTFPASGLIFTVPEDDTRCYLYLTTDWFEDKVVLFDTPDPGRFFRP